MALYPDFLTPSMAEIFFLARNSHRHGKARWQPAETPGSLAIVEHKSHFT